MALNIVSLSLSSNSSSNSSKSCHDVSSIKVNFPTESTKKLSQLGLLLLRQLFSRLIRSAVATTAAAAAAQRTCLFYHESVRCASSIMC